MSVPERWRDYSCEDYFHSALAREGFWDEFGQLWLIEPSERVEEELAVGFLQVGRHGVDSIGFGYRKGHAGFWAFPRMVTQEFQYLAPTIQEFIAGWFGGRIAV